MSAPTPPRFGMKLSDMETEVLAWLATEGLSYRQIARRRGVSEKTAQSTGHRILVKLGARSMPQAVHIGIMTGLIGFRHNCGTRAAVVYHQRHGEEMDPKCRVFDRAWRKSYKELRLTKRQREQFRHDEEADLEADGDLGVERVRSYDGAGSPDL